MHCGSTIRLWRGGLLAALAGLWFGLNSSALRADPTETDASRRQEAIKAETEQLVRRVGTMLRVLEFYRVDRTEEKKLLEEVAGTLNGLSREQMAEVIARLEAAAVAERAADKGKATAERAAAHKRHEEILRSLKGLLSRYDALKDLEQAADRLEKAAGSQFDLSRQTARTVKDLEDLQQGVRTAEEQRKLAERLETLPQKVKQQENEQAELGKYVKDFLKEVDALRGKLTPDQRDRIKKMERLAEEMKVQDAMEQAARRLGTRQTNPAVKQEQFRAANELQTKAAGDLRELARTLRAPQDKLDALREARDRVEQAIRKQEELHDQAKAREAEKAGDLSDKQAALEQDARDTRNLLKPHADELAKKIVPAQAAMKEAEKALRNAELARAAEPQEKAADTLRDVRKDLDKLIAAAEKERSDPLTALKSAAETVDKLIKDQKDTRDQTKQAGDARKTQELSKLADKQGDLARRTDDLKQQSLPPRAETQKALDKAGKAMKDAAKALDSKKAPDAVGKQDRALDALKDAQKALQDQIAEVAKRRDDIAKLEDAAKKLDALTKQEGNIADQARQMADKGTQKNPQAPKDAKELGAKQAAVTPQAKDVGKQIEQTAPEAAKKINEGAKHMEAAKGDLDKNKPSPAARQADDATQKLKDAQKEVAKALDQQKAKEIADQAAMNKQDLQQTADQVAKALEQAKQAEQAAKQAAQAQQPKGEPQANQQQKDLAQLQKEVADKAPRVDAKAAQPPAEKAAEALQKGDLKKALDQQKDAFARLQEAEKNAQQNQPQKPPVGEAKPAQQGEKQPVGQQPKAAAAKPAQQPPQAGQQKNQPQQGAPQNPQTKPAQAKQGEQKPGEPKAGQPKQNQAQTAQAKQGQPKAGEPKAGQPKAGEPKPGQQAGQPKPGQQAAQPKAGQPKPGQQQAAGQPKSGQAKQNQAKAGEAKAAQKPQQQAGQPKPGQQPQQQKQEATQPIAQARECPDCPNPGQGQGKGQGAGKEQKAAQAKSGQEQAGQQGAPSPSQAKTAGQLAQAQKALMEATQQMAKSQEANQGAQGALGQAQAQAPQGVQKQLQQAAQNLAKAGQKLEQGKPGQAGQAQGQAADQLQKALQQLQAAAQAQQNQPQTAQAKPGQGQGQDQGQGQGQKQGQDQGKSQGKSNEKNQGQSTGDRIADGKVSNTPSQLSASKSGEGSFLHLPPRQREMIRQALSGRLPPEYAGSIQQYFANIARGLPAAMPKTPGSR